MWAPRAAARHSRRADDSTQRIITPPAGNTRNTQETAIPTPDPSAITPGEFIAKWRASELKERSAAQEHFIDLCRLLGEPTPADADPTGDYANDPRAIAIAEAARRLVELRDRWLNPPEWVARVDEPVAGYPKRPVPHDEATAKELKKRTLTNLYNARPQWLADAHAALDAAVATAYGWPAGISQDDALRELLVLNLSSEH